MWVFFMPSKFFPSLFVGKVSGESVFFSTFSFFRLLRKRKKEEGSRWKYMLLNLLLTIPADERRKFCILVQK